MREQRLAIPLLAAVWLSGTGGATPPQGNVHAQLDHLVVAIRSLPEGIAEFERLTGVKAMVGGTHPGRGTENALVSFGGGKYLEIIAPQAGATLSAADQPMRTLEHLRIINWAISVSDADAAAAALTRAGFPTTPPQPGSRVTPSGERLEWRTFGLFDRTLATAPFFINWSAATKHPSTTAPAGCELSRVTIADVSTDRLSAALNVLGVTGIAYEKGAPGIAATLRCNGKDVVL